MAEFYDTHAHLDYADFKADFPEILLRAQEAGITRMICIGTDLESSRNSLALAQQHDCLFAVVGWHPSHALEAPPDIRDDLRALACHPKVVALGETGLDYYRLPSGQGGSLEEDDHYKNRQADLYKQHLEVAAETGLNCVIHQRAALEDSLTQLQPYAAEVRGQFHCFAEDPAVMQRIFELGSIVSFTGIATFKSAQNIRDTICAAPLGQFMLETDCPYLAPVPYRGKRCEPAYVKEIAALVAQLKGVTAEELSAATCGAARAFFPKLS